MADQQPKEPKYFGEITNKNETEQIGEIAFYEMQNTTIKGTLRGYIRINAKKAKADERGFAFYQVEISPNPDYKPGVNKP